MTISFRPATTGIHAHRADNTSGLVLWLHDCGQVEASGSANVRPTEDGSCDACEGVGKWALLYVRVVDGAVDTQGQLETTADVVVTDATHTGLTAADLGGHFRETERVGMWDLPKGTITDWRGTIADNRVSSVHNRMPALRVEYYDGGECAYPLLQRPLEGP